MDIIVDGAQDFALQGEPKDVLSAVAAVSEYLRSKGRAILAVHLDGQEISADKLVETLQDKPLSEANELKVDSANVAELASDLIEGLRDAIRELPAACHQLAQVFHGEKPEEGFEPFQHLADIWSSVKQREALIIGAAAIDESAMKVGGKQISEHHRELNQFLNECATAIEKNDCVLLGDLLEYELAPRAELEAEIFAAIEAACAKLPDE
jgi:hypothetical protein